MSRRKRRPRSKSAPAAVRVEKTGPSKWRQWANENMIAAMESVKGGAKRQTSSRTAWCPEDHTLRPCEGESDAWS